MGITLSTGQIHPPINFGVSIPVIEFGRRKYGDDYPVLEKLYDWVDIESPRYSAQDLQIERLTTDEIKFFCALLEEFLEYGPEIHGISYDAGLNDRQIDQLNLGIRAIKIYLNARQEGLEHQQSC